MQEVSNAMQMIEKSLIQITFFGEIEGQDENTPKSKFETVLKKIEYKMGKAADLYMFERDEKKIKPSI